MQLFDLLTPGDLGRVTARRWDDYVRTAEAFLARYFPWSVAGRPPAAVRAAILRSATEAAQSGLVSEAENLGYLIGTVMLGRRFVLNPLYLDLLNRAGWIDDYGRPARKFAFDPLYDQIEAWDALRARDLAPADALLARLERLYRTGAPEGPAALHLAVPAIAGAVEPALLAAFADAATRNAVAAGLTGPDAAAHAAIAVLLGIEFETDPLHHGIGQALARTDPEARRRAYGAAVRETLARRAEALSDAS